MMDGGTSGVTRVGRTLQLLPSEGRPVKKKDCAATRRLHITAMPAAGLPWGREAREDG